MFDISRKQSFHACSSGGKRVFSTKYPSDILMASESDIRTDGTNERSPTLFTFYAGSSAGFQSEFYVNIVLLLSVLSLQSELLGGGV
jgi:hypothetical protein